MDFLEYVAISSFGIGVTILIIMMVWSAIKAFINREQK